MRKYKAVVMYHHQSIRDVVSCQESHSHSSLILDAEKKRDELMETVMRLKLDCKIRVLEIVDKDLDYYADMCACKLCKKKRYWLL